MNKVEKIQSKSLTPESTLGDLETISDDKGLHNLPHAFTRSLSAVMSYEQMKQSKKIADYHAKIVVVGDGAVGKTCLLISYVQHTFPTDYIPTVFENYVTKIRSPKGKCIELALWDTAGQEEYNRLRPLSYTNVDVLMVCYSVDNKVSLKNVEELWFPEVKHFCFNTPIMLVGLKSDLYAGDNLDDLIDPKEADTLASKLGAFVHIQCSAKLRDNIDEVFNTAINASLYDEMNEDRSTTTLLKNPFKKVTQSASPKKETEKVQPSRSGTKKENIRKHKCIII